MERLDHVLIRVDDLEACVNVFRRAGFKVYYGTQMENAYNAMIYFQDQSFIELVDTTKFPFLLKLLAKSKLLYVLGNFYRRIGAYALSNDLFLDYSIYAKDIEKQHERVKKKVSKLYHLKRKDVFGALLQWKLFVPSSSQLPFVMSDYKPHKLPEKNATEHKNKALGIRQVDIWTTYDLEKLQHEMLSVYDSNKAQLCLNGETLEIKTKNANIIYQKAQVNKIVSIRLNSIKPNLLSSLVDYGIS
ncbi:VOC family protein [Aureispira anguillae]|uniref:VOC family protein n=1 Tax=Aureispira anguillae TaxID=2864201 RepID=A0A915Y9C2_9BACT|nr:VOC family protein [Aureispira anguillae]BDS09323.1 VOC family protein [Aureispira anguillae]